MLFCIVGPTCSGKTTLEQKLVNTGNFGRIVSFTTRPKRAGEIDGVHYYFMNDPPEDTIEKNHFNGYYYGIEAVELAMKLQTHSKVVLVIEPHGLLEIERFCNENKLPMVKVYLKQDINTLLERFLLNRINEATTMETVKYNAKRIISMFSEWLTWPTATCYDLVFEGFNQDTEGELVSILERWNA